MAVGYGDITGLEFDETDFPFIIESPPAEYQARNDLDVYSDDNVNEDLLGLMGKWGGDGVNAQNAMELSERTFLSQLASNEIQFPSYRKPASSMFMWEQQHRIAGAVSQLLANNPDDYYWFDLRPSTFEYEFEELDQAIAPKMLAGMLDTLNYLGIDGYDGSLLGFLHCEPTLWPHRFRFWLRGITNAEIAEPLGKLAAFNHFKSGPDDDSNNEDTSHGRVRIERITDLPLILSKLVQPSWSYRKAMIYENGVKVSDRLMPYRPEPHSTMLMQWLDQWELPDLTMMFGLRVHEGKLVRDRGCP